MFSDRDPSVHGQNMDHVCDHHLTVQSWSKCPGWTGGRSVHVTILVLSRTSQYLRISGYSDKRAQCACDHPCTVWGWWEYLGSYALVWYNSYSILRIFLCHSMATLHGHICHLLLLYQVFTLPMSVTSSLCIRSLLTSNFFLNLITSVAFFKGTSNQSPSWCPHLVFHYPTPYSTVEPHEPHAWHRYPPFHLPLVHACDSSSTVCCSLVSH